MVTAGIGTAGARAALELIEQCRPLFRGKDPEVQGGALTELVSLWLAAYPKAVRQMLLAQLVNAVCENGAWDFEPSPALAHL